MSTLSIKDLGITVEMDGAALRGVCGGWFYGRPYWPGFGSYDYRVGFAASQDIAQVQSVNTANGNNVAFSHGITSIVAPEQTATNRIG